MSIKSFSHCLLLTVAFISLNVLSLSVHAQDYTKITRLGTSQSICAGGVETKEQLQEFFANNPNAAREILADAGWSGNADDLLAAIERGDIIERSYPVGTQLTWMGAKVNGKNIAHPFREWAGDKSFEAFQINLSSSCNVYHLAIPKACCNISLVSVEADTSAQCRPEPEPVAAAPIAPAEPIVAEPEGNPLAIVPYVGIFAGSETRARFEISWNTDVVDSSGITGLRAGLAKPINSRLSGFIQGSYFDRNGINEGNVFADSNFAFDIGLEYKVARNAFIGGGIGSWDVNDSDFRQTSLFGHVGGGIGKSNFQWFVEGRVFDTDSDVVNDSISDNRMFSGGIRYLIK